ncbi:MAG TPA: hypothetical protein VGX27_05540 [Candidatus Dormibacteraeota bacterium]|nr:hypothetical protein [Candidatus Dormibacteraeota bacterium]
MGMVALSGQLLEIVVTAHLGQVLGLATFEAAERIAGRLGATPTLDLIASLTADREVKAWAKQARRAIDARNHAIHTPWFEDPETHRLGVLERRPKVRQIYRSPVELEKTISLLQQAARAGLALVTIDVELPPGPE